MDADPYPGDNANLDQDRKCKINPLVRLHLDPDFSSSWVPASDDQLHSTLFAFVVVIVIIPNQPKSRNSTQSVFSFFLSVSRLRKELFCSSTGQTRDKGRAKAKRNATYSPPLSPSHRLRLAVNGDVSSTQQSIGPATVQKKGGGRTCGVVRCISFFFLFRFWFHFPKSLKAPTSKTLFCFVLFCVTIERNGEARQGKARHDSSGGWGPCVVMARVLVVGPPIHQRHGSERERDGPHLDG